MAHHSSNNQAAGSRPITFETAFPFQANFCGICAGYEGTDRGLYPSTWGVQVLRYPNFFFSGMEADRNVKVIGGDVAVL